MVCSYLPPFHDGMEGPPHHWMFVLMVIYVFQGEAKYQGLIYIFTMQEHPGSDHFKRCINVSRKKTYKRKCIIQFA